MALELQGLVTLLSGYHPSRRCISSGVVLPLVLHLLGCHTPRCRTSSRLVLCLHGYCVSEYRVSSGIRRLAVMPP